MNLTEATMKALLGKLEEARSHKEYNEKVAPRKDTEKVFGEIEDTPKRDRFTSKNGWGYKDAQASEENEKGISKDIEKYKTLKSFAKDARASAEAYNDTARHWDEKASELVKSKRKNEDKLLESITADDLDDIFTYLGEMQHYAENSYDQWVCISGEVRDILDAQFNEGYSISYCLRWLQQALDDLIGDEDGVRADLENQLNENKKPLEERANFDKLDTVEYWAFCIGADLMRDEIFADGVGCDEAYEKAYELAEEFMNSEEFKDTTMSGYDALRVFLANKNQLNENNEIQEHNKSDEVINNFKNKDEMYNYVITLIQENVTSNEELLDKCKLILDKGAIATFGADVMKTFYEKFNDKIEQRINELGEEYIGAVLAEYVFEDIVYGLEDNLQDVIA